MSILRNKLKNKFSQIPNSAITDLTLNAGAFRVLAYLFSRPDGWTVNNSDISKQLGIKRAQTIADYWKVLISSGWITREKDDKNRFYIYTLCETNEPQKNAVYTHTVYTHTENADIRKNRTLSNTDSFSNTNNTIVNLKIDDAIKDKPIESASKVNTDIDNVIDYFNIVAEQKRSKKSKPTRTAIRARLKEYTIDQLKAVIDNRVKTWGDDPKMKIYIRPSTIFNATNFENYVSEVVTQEPEKPLSKIAACNTLENLSDTVLPPDVEMLFMDRYNKIAKNRRFLLERNVRNFSKSEYLAWHDSRIGADRRTIRNTADALNYTNISENIKGNETIFQAYNRIFKELQTATV